MLARENCGAGRSLFRRLRRCADEIAHPVIWSRRRGCGITETFPCRSRSERRFVNRCWPKVLGKGSGRPGRVSRTQIDLQASARAGPPGDCARAQGSGPRADIGERGKAPPRNRNATWPDAPSGGSRLLFAGAGNAPAGHLHRGQRTFGGSARVPHVNVRARRLRPLFACQWRRFTSKPNGSHKACCLSRVAIHRTGRGN